MNKLKTIIKKPSTLITIIGVALIPALYNLSFLSAMWDPYGHLKDLPVAVVNQDHSATLNNKELTIGQDMVDLMKEDKELDFHFVSSREAKDGLKKGQYYMVITLPADLSEKATTLLTKNPQKALISYETSKGHSFVASKMSDSAMEKLKNSLSEKITKQYTRSVFDSLSSLQDGLSQASQGGQALENGVNQLEGGADKLSTGLSSLSEASKTLSTGTKTFDSGLNAYTDGVNKVDGGLTSLSAGIGKYTASVSKLGVGLAQVDANSGKLLSAMEQLKASSSQLQPLVDGSNQMSAGLESLKNQLALPQDKQDQLQNLVTGLGQLQSGLDQLDHQLDSGNLTTISNLDTTGLASQLGQVQGLAGELLEAAQADKASAITALQSTKTYQSLSSDQQAELVAAIQNSPSVLSEKSQLLASTMASLGQTLTAMQGQLEQVSHAQEQLLALKTAVHQSAQGADQLLPLASATVNQLASGLNQASSALDAQLLPASLQLASGVTQLQEKLASNAGLLLEKTASYTGAIGQINAGTQQLVAKNPELEEGINQLSSGSSQLNRKTSQLLSGSSQLLSGTEKLSNGAGQLQDGGQKVSSGLGQLSSGIVDLTSALQDADQQLSLVSVQQKNADSVSSPVQTRHQDKDQVSTNGTGMAPYMISVALMVAALSTNVIFAKSLDGKEYNNRWAWFKGKLLLNGLISTLAALILYFAIVQLGVVASHPMLTLGMILLTSWTLMALVTALIGWNSRYGAFVALLLLLLQLGSSAGTYPIELSPTFFHTVQPFLPMTYSVSALRQSISMTGAVGVQVGRLLIFFLLYVVLGLVFYRQEENQ